MALTPKQERFVQEYLLDLNATQAAIRAGYSARTADRIGPELLGKTCVSQAIQEAKKARERRMQITQDRVVRELAKVAFANGTVYAKVTGGGTRVELVDTDTLTDEQRAAISCIKEGKYGIEVSTYDKVRALELLGKHLGVFGTGGAPAAAEENNIFEVIEQSTREEIDTDGIPEIEPQAKPDDDVVE